MLLNRGFLVEEAMMRISGIPVCTTVIVLWLCFRMFGHFLIQTASLAHTAIVLDVSNGAKPVAVSRVKFDDNYYPHWSAWDAATNRIVITPSGSGSSRLYLLKFDPQSGAVKVDESFRDTDGNSGFNFENRERSHGWKGSGLPHGAVFSR